MQLNKDLINPLEIENAKLKQKIEYFKKYDAERKEYYSELIAQAAANEEYIKELEEGTAVSNLKEKNKELQLEIQHQKKLIKRYLDRLHNANVSLWNDEEYFRFKEMKMLQKNELLEEIARLKRTVNVKDITISKLISKINNDNEETT